MKFVIIGIGKIGETLVEKLSQEKHDVVIVDKNAEVVETLVNKYDIFGVIGGGADRSSLMDAGVENADFVIACTSRDELNILCCILAKKLGAKYTLARVRDPEYFNEIEYMNSELELDMFFNPERRTAFEISNILAFPSATDVERFADGAAVMIEFRIKPENPMIGMSIYDVVKKHTVSALFSMVERGDKVYIPRGDFVIQEGDVLHVTASEEEITKFSKKMQIFRRGAKSVTIIGGGKIGYYLAEELIKKKISVKIIEKDEDRCMELAEKLPKATIINGDGTDHELLDEMNIEKSNALVALTGMDEENVIVSLYAISKKVNKVVSKVDRPTIQQMVKHLGLDTILSPINAVADQILKFVRAQEAGGTSGINQLYKIHDKVEAIEFTLTADNCAFLGVPLKALNMRKNFLVNGIIREGKYIIPTGDTVFQAGDDVLIVTTEKGVRDINAMLK